MSITLLGLPNASVSGGAEQRKVPGSSLDFV